MAAPTTRRIPASLLPAILLVGAMGIAALFLWIPETIGGAGLFVVNSLISVAPMVVPGVLLAAWITASGFADNIARTFDGHLIPTVLAASLIGAITPVCGVTVLPLMAGLLGAGVPLAPIMAFWLSSPITDPAMLATTAATLGLSFAVGKTIAAFLLGLLGGLATALFAKRPWYHQALRRNRLVGNLGSASCATASGFDPAVWKSADRRRRFRNESWSITRLILICLIPAFAAEYALNAMLQPQSLTPFIGAENWWAVPVAVFVGAPAYLDGYAALPLTRSLIDHGMSPGAAMAFLISGGVVSIWGAMAIFPVLKIKPFLLYLGLALAGSLASGWLFDWLA
ncbi:MAG: permease [Alphaproteobacteria bacterium]|nr:permease [Alphaproteobacteria bacterium]